MEIIANIITSAKFLEKEIYFFVEVINLEELTAIGSLIDSFNQQSIISDKDYSMIFSNSKGEVRQTKYHLGQLRDQDIRFFL